MTADTYPRKWKWPKGEKMAMSVGLALEASEKESEKESEQMLRSVLYSQATGIIPPIFQQLLLQLKNMQPWAYRQPVPGW